MTNPRAGGVQIVFVMYTAPLFNRFVMLKLDAAVSEESVVVRYLQDLRQLPPSLRC